MMKYLIYVVCGCGLLPSLSLLFLGSALLIGVMELMDLKDRESTVSETRERTK